MTHDKQLLCSDIYRVGNWNMKIMNKNIQKYEELIKTGSRYTETFWNFVSADRFHLLILVSSDVETQHYCCCLTTNTFTINIFVIMLHEKLGWAGPVNRKLFSLLSPWQQHATNSDIWWSRPLVLGGGIFIMCVQPPEPWVTVFSTAGNKVCPQRSCILPAH